MAIRYTSSTGRPDVARTYLNGENVALRLESIHKLLCFCVRSNYFVCNGMYFRTNTCPMGSPLSSILAAIFMEVFEDGVLENTKIPIKVWKRFVDDTLVIVKKGEEDSLLEELNAHHECIEFSMDKEKDGSIAFFGYCYPIQPRRIEHQCVSEKHSI